MGLVSVRITRIEGHLGELIQGRLGPDGQVGLITLPCPALHIEVTRQDGAFAFHQPDGVAIRYSTLTALFRMLDQPLQGRWTLRMTMPVQAGAGASTAAILAVARHLAPELPRQQLEALCHSLERATDPLLAPRPEELLWASREGRVLRQLPALPRMRVIGGFAGGGVRTDPDDLNFPDISDILTAWPAACASPAAIGELVSRASRRSLLLRGSGDFTALEAIGREFGAWGVSIAHTGTARGFLLPVQSKATPILTRLAALGWSHLQNFCIGRRTPC